MRRRGALGGRNERDYPRGVGWRKSPVDLAALGRLDLLPRGRRCGDCGAVGVSELVSRMDGDVGGVGSRGLCCVGRGPYGEIFLISDGLYENPLFFFQLFQRPHTSFGP